MYEVLIGFCQLKIFCTTSRSISWREPLDTVQTPINLSRLWLSLSKLVLSINIIYTGMYWQAWTTKDKKSKRKMTESDQYWLLICIKSLLLFTSPSPHSFYFFASLSSPKRQTFFVPPQPHSVVFQKIITMIISTMAQLIVSAISPRGKSGQTPDWFCGAWVDNYKPVLFNLLHCWKYG